MMKVSNQACRSRINWHLGIGLVVSLVSLFDFDVLRYFCIVAVIGPARSEDTLYAVTIRTRFGPFPLRIRTTIFQGYKGQTLSLLSLTPKSHILVSACPRVDMFVKIFLEFEKPGRTSFGRFHCEYS
jgi:hypothetical protein